MNMRPLVAFLALSSFFVSTGSALTMQERIDQCLAIIQNQQGSAHAIPQAILNESKGVAIVKVSKGGLVVGGYHGEGVVISRTATGWSAPCAFNLSGGSFGAQIGFETKDYVFVLNTAEALAMFTSNDSVKWDATAAGTAGPEHDGKTKSQINDSPIFIYQASDGAYGGATVGGTVLTCENAINQDAYGTGVLTSEILDGKVKVPAYAEPLLKALRGK